MRFWDTSAIVPLLVEETTSDRLSSLLASDREMSVWWGTVAECVSAVTRKEREGLDLRRVRHGFSVLDELSALWNEAEPLVGVRDNAIRLLRVHALRAADALQLAAAVSFSEGRPATLPFVTLDARLADAAEREGFPILGLDPPV